MNLKPCMDDMSQGRGTVELEDPVSSATGRKGRARRSTKAAKDALIMAKVLGDEMEKQDGRANVLMQHTLREMALKPRSAWLQTMASSRHPCTCRRLF